VCLPLLPLYPDVICIGWHSSVDTTYVIYGLG
jgi:hypothetical protein